MNSDATPSFGERQMEPLARPGDRMANRPLHFIWLVDCSGSMAIDGKIQAVNNAIKDAIPLMRDVADENPNARVLVRALAFSSGAHWHVADPAPIQQFRWEDVEANGVTDLGAALQELALKLKMPPMEERALPPVIVLLSDGEPTDAYTQGLDAFFAEPWGKKAVRIAIAIGRDANLSVLRAFIGNPEMEPLQANNPDALVRYIKWCSTEVLKAASSPASQRTDQPQSSANIPVLEGPIAATLDGTETDVW